MNTERTIILEMVDQGNITVDEAVELITSLNESNEPENWSFPGFDALTIEVCLN